jgi:hypothetical protein
MMDSMAMYNSLPYYSPEVNYTYDMNANDSLSPPPPPTDMENEALSSSSRFHKDASWWTEDNEVQSCLSIEMSYFDEQPQLYRLEMDFGGWKWAVLRTFGDIKNFYVNLCRHDRSTFSRLQNHFPIVGSRREGVWHAKHADDYNSRVAVFLRVISQKLDCLLCPLLRELLQVDEGLYNYLECLERAQSVWRGYVTRCLNEPVVDYVRHRALVLTYDLDRERFYHCWQLAKICVNLVLGKTPIPVHQETLRLHTMSIGADMYADFVKQMVLETELGLLFFTPEGEWTYRQRIFDHWEAEPLSDIFLWEALAVSVSEGFAVDSEVCNDLISEVICETIFFEIFSAASPRFVVEEFKDYQKIIEDNAAHL